MAKRKKDDEYRTFQDEWTEEFAFVERAGSAVCLICNDKITSLKRSNVKRHFDTRHATFASKYPAGDSRKKACQELLSRVQASQQQLRVWTRQGDYNSASFAGSLAIVRNGKPFTDGEYAKTFMLDVANELFDDLPNKDKIIKRIQDMPLSARTVHDRTIVMANKVEETQVKDINAAPFFSLALDESTDMCDRQFGEVMSLVIRVINFIVARALNDRQFKTLLDEVNNYPGLLLHSNVRWLSRGKVLSRFAACLNEIRTFLEMKGVGHPELADTEWLLKFYYLVDLTEHLNQLNVKMQGIGNTVLSLQQAVFAFENKLELFITDLETGRLLHFEKLSQFKDACTASEPIQNLDLHQLAGCTSSLLQSFKARFGEFREHTRLFKFITHPNECSLNTADLNYIPGVSVRDFEAEVADLKASDMWVNKFKSLNEDLERITRQKAELASKHMWTEMKKLQPEDQLILKTWNALPVTYHTLQRFDYCCYVTDVKVNIISRISSSHQSGQGRTHQGLDIVCADGSTVYAPFDVVLNGALTVYGNPSTAQRIINTGINLQGEGLCFKLFYVSPVQTSGLIRKGQKIGTMLPMQRTYPGITSHVHVQMCDKSDPTRYF
ncbi:hypothetical protein NHX12_011087 [Muraenolepis orangiensis]|uniref:SPIN-DOC-like zinc-finger domain-containing protein n=1 Tax=Muraenolepis orangiensis TaxID=630683 RepID=A0A9Q0DF63_9TELE|nr:hypothetical protein NHX12_011087 [Muraenolepis orangiensis]